jgi:glycosyltransferase involved in cell wall biosynthesis
VLESYSDSRIKLIQNTENLGLTKNLNRAIDIAKGEFIARMDADDICMPTRFEKQLAAFNSNTQLGICGTWFENFGDLSGITRYAISHDEIAFGLLYQSQFCHPTVMFRKSVLDNNELRYDETFKTAQDYELWSRIIFKTHACNLPEVLLKYRFHSQSISSTNKEQQLTNKKKIIINQFNNYEINLNENELVSFMEFCSSVFMINNLNSLLNVLTKLIQKNDVYLKMVNIRWFHLCYNSRIRLEDFKYYDKQFISRFLRLKYFIKKII